MEKFQESGEPLSMGMCCEEFVRYLAPRNPRSGYVTERHECPRCNQVLVVQFRSLPPARGGGSRFEVCGVEWAN